MITQSSNTSSGANLSGTILDNLQPGLPLQPQISAALNTALKTQLAAAATAAKLPALTGLINAMPAADLVAAKDLTLQAFAQQQIDPMVASDPAMKAAVDNEIAKLPATGTVSAALSLTSPLASQPLLKGIVADAQLTALLAASPTITSAMQARFVTLYDANTGSMPDFWTQLASDPQLGAAVPQIQLTLQLGTLTENNPDLVDKLIAQFHPTTMFDLTSLTTDQLVGLMTAENVKVPSSVAASTTPATITSYASTMVATLQQAFPTAYVAKPFAASPDPVNQQVAAFLDKSTDFDFAATNIDQYLAKNPAAVSGLSATEAAAFTSRLKAAQRVFQMSPDGDQMVTLIDYELDSAYKIAAVSNGSFVAEYGAELGGEAHAQQLYANATRITNFTSLIIRVAQENSGGLLVQTASGGGTTTMLDQNLPNWQALFGTTSTCQCSECRAMDGPAAYFVSLLKFLGGLGLNSDHNSPLDVLIGNANANHTTYKGKPIAKPISNPRRPDLAYLKLNCANADTALPYVDLINEILENYVSNSRVTSAAAHDTPDDATTAVLDVTPEYMQTSDAISAYDKLNASSILYPYSLPFDRYLDITRSYLGFAGVSLYQLEQTFGTFLDAHSNPVPPLPRATELAAEYLLISEPEYELITGQDFSGNPSAAQSLPACLGYPAQSVGAIQPPNAEAWIAKIAQVSEFLSRTNLAFSDLVDLLGTQYLNPLHLDPELAASLTIPTDPCDITAMKIQNAQMPAPPLPFLAPLPPFIRLWRKLGWTIAELDYALRAFGQVGVPTSEATDQITQHRGNPNFPPPPQTEDGIYVSPIFIEPDFIRIAAQIRQLTKTLNLSVSDVVSLWADIDVDGRKSPYITLFQNKAVANPPVPAFRLLYSVPLSAAPGAAIPRLLPDGASTQVAGSEEHCAAYDATTHTLSFIGTMTEAQRDTLLTWANTGAGEVAEQTELAVQLLYAQRWYDGIQVAPTIRTFSRGRPPTARIVTDLVDDQINVILAALRIGATDLAAIRQDTGSSSADRLSIGNLSAFHRYAMLAQALGLSVTDLITLKNLTGLQPFDLASGTTGPRTDPMVKFVVAAQQVIASPFNVAQLAYVYGPASQSSSLIPLQATQDALMATILTGLQNIAAANAFTPDPNGTALRKKLAVLIPSTSQLDAVMGLIAGTADYTTPLAALPSGLTLPASQPVAFALTATVGNTITNQDEITLTITPGTAGSSPVPISYQVQATDTTASIAASLAAQISANSALAATGAAATVSGSVISLMAPPGLSWTQSVTPATATETVTLAGSLVATGPLSTATIAALTALPGGGDAAFGAALQSLANQAQDLLTQNLGFLVPAGPPYSVALAALPVDVSVPSGGQISFSAGQIVCVGPMLNSTRTALQSAGDATYNTALQQLYDLAWNTPGAKVTVLGSLIDTQPTSTAADRYDYVLAGLLTYLTATQSRNLVKQTLAQTLGMAPNVVALLIDGNAGLGWPNGLLPSAFIPPQAAINDFLGGLVATYTGPAPGNTVTVLIDPGVDLDGTEPAFASASWCGKLLPPATGAYSFAVTTNGGGVPVLAIGGEIVTLVTGTRPLSTINLTAGQLYDVALTFPTAPANAQVTLAWCMAPASPATLAPIPALAFMSCAANGTYPVLLLLYRIAILTNGLSMSATELAYFSTNALDFSGTDPATSATTPFSLLALGAPALDSPALFNQWQRLSNFYGLKAGLPASNTTLIDVFASAAAQAPLATVVSTIAAATNWDATQLQALAGAYVTGDTQAANAFNFTIPMFRNELPLVQLAGCLAVCTNVGLAAQQLYDWANPAAPPAGVSPYQSIAGDIQNTVKAKYHQATWLQIAKPLNDNVREASKDSLIAYIVYLIPDAAYSTVDDLYGFFLIDVEMCTCMDTSRLVQASAAVQLFVQRCLLNLESPNVASSAFTATDIAEWNMWRKNYRVSQAAVEVFLYPENWITPELRPSATPIFQDLQTTLLQNSVVEANVEAAFLGYLQALQQVARLEIVGFYVDNDTAAETKITHVIARTLTTPYAYFYRTLDNVAYSWSPWEQINVDIDGETIVPVIWNRRLFLFWPIYTEVTDPTTQNTQSSQSIVTQPSSAGTTTSVPPTQPSTKTLNIQLAYSEYKNGAWTPKQVTAESLAPSLYQTYSWTLDQSTFVYSAATTSNNGVQITIFTPTRAIAVQTQSAFFAVTTALAAIGPEPPQSSSVLKQGSSARSAIVQLVQNLTNIAMLFYEFPNVDASLLSQLFNHLGVVIGIMNESSDLSLSDVISALENASSAGGILETLYQANLTWPIGSFFFDGSQGDASFLGPQVSGSLLTRYADVASRYMATPGVSTQFSYQDVVLNFWPPSALVPFAFLSNSSTAVEVLLDSQYVLSATITYAQQFLPSYAFQTADQPFENAAFYADQRRTYLAISAETGFRQTVVRNGDLAASPPPSYVTVGQVYFFNHYQPWVGELIKRLNWAGRGISYLLEPDTQALNAEKQPSGQSNFDFKSYYAPLPTVAQPYPEEVMDFGPTQKLLVAEQASSYSNPDYGTPAGDFAYAAYNWEVFFHIPLLIATQLSQNQQFDDAETWFRYIFNPTNDPKANPVEGYKGGSPNAYWNFLPLNALPQDQGLAALLGATSGPNKVLLNAQLAAWEQTPFEPDVIAQFRPVAYQKTVVMKYLDHLIAWGDYCFAQNNRESIYEAIQYYILADQILGPKPVVIPSPGVVLDQTYYELVREPGGINGLGNANVQLENAFPFVTSATVSKTGKPTGTGVLPRTPYFCTPANPTLMGYYDTVADRLYKIRHCMNIQGQVEQLSLFAAPINPGLLVAAEAAGVDLSSVLSDISAAVPHYRFTTMIAKALELCEAVRSLGGALLSAMEKYDGEGLSLLRARQEVAVQQAVLTIKQLQVQEATDQLAGLQATQAVIQARQTYYQGLFQGGLSSGENAQLLALTLAELFKVGGQVSEAMAGGLAVIPQIAVGINGAFGSPSAIVTFGGQQMSEAASSAARVLGALADMSSYIATMAGLSAGWARRSAEWNFQAQTATLELAEVQQQINAATVRSQIATQDVTNQNLLIANATAVQSALKSKFTNQQLYAWMVSQVSAVFFQCYQMAYDLAKRAEACYRFELGIAQSSYIQFGYWDSLKQGLLSGERLFQDLKRLENAYLDQNQREYEISKSISLLLLDPTAFVALRLTGQCIITFPEAYFDMDYPGHYMRRIRNVSLTIPCVAGPYTSVNCTLTLVQSKIRLTNALPYAETPIGSDPRFSYNFSGTESIATSTAQNDSGLFEVNFRDERYLPFEGSGLVSQWLLTMPPDCNAFDFNTITDIIINLRYTARNGGDGLRRAAKAAAILPPGMMLGAVSPSLSPSIPKQNNLERCFSLRHEFPTEWYKFLNPPGATSGTSATSMQISLGNERFPFQYRSSMIQITQAQFIVILSGSGSAPALNLASGSSPTGTVPLALSQATANVALYSFASPPAPTPVQGAPAAAKSWILLCPAGAGALANIVDILLIATYSAAP